MFDVGYSELLVCAVVALVVIGPKDLPKAMRFVGHWAGKARGVVRQLRAGMDDIVRESEMAELEKKWAEENARIMREFPTTGDVSPVVPADRDDASRTDFAAADALLGGEMRPLPPVAEQADHAATPPDDEPLLPGMDDAARAGDAR